MVGDGERGQDISCHSQWSPPVGNATVEDAERSADLAIGCVHHVAQDGPIVPVNRDQTVLRQPELGFGTTHCIVANAVGSALLPQEVA
jgi:hypothetical protein